MEDEFHHFSDGETPDDDLPMIVLNNDATSSNTNKAPKGGRKSLGSMDENAKKKAETAAQKLNKKQKLEEEKLAKRVAKEENKIYKPTECMKYMNIELHPTLLSAWYMGDLTRETSAAGVKVTPAQDICDPSLVMWTRSLPRKLQAGDQVELTPAKQPCNKALYITTLQDVTDNIHQHTLSAHLSQVKALAGCDVTCIMFGVKDYFKTAGRKTQNSSPKLSEIDLEMAITDVLVSSNCDTCIVNTPNDLALTIVQFTKALAEAPHKLAKRAFDEQADFFMRGDSKKCISVGADGLGKERLWQQMIAVLPSSSLETSRAFCSQYKSPYLLYKTLEDSSKVKEIADIGVARAAVPGAKTRRLGPEFAKKLNILFTSTRGDELLD